MKKGKKLLILLVAVLTLTAAFSLTSFAEGGYSNTANFSQELLGSAALNAPDAVYDGSAHGAVLEDKISGSKPDSYKYDDYITRLAPYGKVSDITYSKSDENQTQGETLTSAPKDAGYYLASVTVTTFIYDTASTNPDWKQEEHVLTVFYQIKKAEVEAVWDDATLVYNGNPQYPEATASVAGGESVKLDVVSASAADKLIDAGSHRVVASMPEDSDAASNYVLKQTGATKNYVIEKLPVELKWKRPVYDEKGEPTGDFVEVDEDTMIKLVYDYTDQAPTAEITNIVRTDNVDDTGKVEVILEGQGQEANAAGKYYVAKATGISGSRSANYSFSNQSRKFQIIPRPVSLKWGYKPEENADAKYAKVVDSATEGYDFKTTYNGLKQAPLTEIANIPKDEYGDEDYVKIGTPDLVHSEHIDGTVIDEDRVYTDAGKYSLQPGKLSDERNYTYYTLFQDDTTGDMYLNDGSKGAKEYVKDYDALYTIEQYEVKSVVWGKTDFTYDANYHMPTAEIADLQGPDTSAEVRPVVVAVSLLLDKETTLENGAWNANDDEDDPHYLAQVTSLEGERAGNYDYKPILGTGSTDFFIHKKALTVKANNKAITYGDAPANAGVSYSGLVNGTPNNNDKKSDGTPGTYKDENDAAQAVIKGDVKYSYSYAKNGKPGTYTITPDVSGLKSRNYKISAANGTLTVNDKVSTLVAQGTKKGSKGIKLSWNSVSGAVSYDVYMSKCNSKGKIRTPKFVKNVQGNTLVVKKLGKKKLKAKTCYKYYVVAKNAAGNAIATSNTGHFITGNVKGKTTNAKSMSVNATSATIAKGGTFKLSASYKKAKSGKKYKLNNNAHSPLTKFISENPAVAAVDANGIVTGVGTGWCRVYVQGVTGMWTVVEINVK